MEVTKYEHACLLVSRGSDKLLIDPGGYTKLPSHLEGIGTVIITHEHFDHLDVPNLRKVLGQSPQAKIFSTEHVAASLKEEGLDCQAVKDQLTTSSGGFELHFKEVDHSIIYGSSPCCNLTIGLDDSLYYPGDSFASDGRNYRVLALPASGPWFNMSEAIDMAKDFGSGYIFATHDIHASEKGYDSFYNWVGRHISEDVEMVRLAVGESHNFEINR